jgi:hypothetical protein
MNKDQQLITGAAGPSSRRSGSTMETRRFDELTVALARGGSRRGVLRGLVAGVLGALALDRSGAFAKDDKDKPEQGGGRPVTSPAKPVCPNPSDLTSCPLCFEARFGEVGDGDQDRRPGCCKPDGKDQDCRNCEWENATYCAARLNNGAGTCVEATCEKRGSQFHCTYRGKDGFCNQTAGYGSGYACCPVFTSANFGHCVQDPSSTCPQPTS